MGERNQLLADTLDRTTREQKLKSDVSNTTRFAAAVAHDHQRNMDSACGVNVEVRKRSHALVDGAPTERRCFGLAELLQIELRRRDLDTEVVFETSPSIRANRC